MSKLKRKRAAKSAAKSAPTTQVATKAPTQTPEQAQIAALEKRLITLEERVASLEDERPNRLGPVRIPQLPGGEDPWPNAPFAPMPTPGVVPMTPTLPQIDPYHPLRVTCGLPAPTATKAMEPQFTSIAQMEAYHAGCEDPKDWSTIPRSMWPAEYRNKQGYPPACLPFASENRPCNEKAAESLFPATRQPVATRPSDMSAGGNWGGAEL